MAPYYGKYRGTVTNNVDPNRMGRLQVSCPHVLDLNLLAWAMPCVPFAGINTGFYMMPGVGSNVWVEFEAGDIEQPIWSGCFWNPQQIPTAALFPTVRTIVSGGAELTLDGTPGAESLSLKIGPPAKLTPCTIKCDVTGIEISSGAGTVKLGLSGVDVNNGALQVI